jgi:hypothetical protein
VCGNESVNRPFGSRKPFLILINALIKSFLAFDLHVDEDIYLLLLLAQVLSTTLLSRHKQSRDSL